MLFHQFVHPEQVACFIIEPVQGEGGFIGAPKASSKH
jgi:4-aminobutyrate aminotransferase